MQESTGRETSSAFGGLVVATAILLAFVYALGDSQAFAHFVSNLMDQISGWF